jgi:flagellar hook assembly protein FlgD
MQTSAIGQITGTASTTSASASALSGLESEDFFRILVSELQQQDPFEPTETADMIGQVSQIRSIELTGQLTETLEQMTRQQHVSGTSELIGKYVVATVTASDGSEAAIEGVVTSVRFDGDGVAVLELDTGQSVQADDVTWITTLAALEAYGTTDEATAQAAADDDGADDDGAKSDATARRRAEPQESPA